MPFGAAPRRLGCGCRVAAVKSAHVACLLCASALAGETPAPSAAPTDRALEEIVVTGTRLRITAIETVAPVTVLSRRDIERGGADSIGKVLQTLPAVTGSQLNTNVKRSGRAERRAAGAATGRSARICAAAPWCCSTGGAFRTAGSARTHPST